MACGVEVELAKNGVMVREKRGSFGCIMRLKRRISHGFGRMLSRENIIPVSDQENENVAVTMVIRNGYSYDFLDVLSTDQKEPNGNIPSTEADVRNSLTANGNSPGAKKCADMGNQHSEDQLPKLAPKQNEHHHQKPDLLRRQWSDSDGPARESQIVSDPSVVQLRQIKPPRPKSECMLLEGSTRSHRFSAFRGASPFGKTDTYVKLEQLGEGSYATVYKGISNLNNKLVALKEIRLQEEEGTPFTAIREASLLKDLRHSNVVTLHDIIHTKETLTFVFEFVNTDLSQYLERHAGGLHPSNVKLFFFQLLRGLAYIHEKRVLHRDLKPQNLLISEIGELKLADFGLARAKSVPSRTYSHEVVTLWYRPPDVLLGSTDYSTSLDMWGVGCIFVEMVSGAPAFPGIKDSSDQLNKIWKVLGTPTEETWEGVTRYQSYKLVKFGNHRPQTLGNAFPKLKSITNAECIASDLLQVQPRRRLLAKGALRHQYFSDLPPKIYELPDQVSIFNVPGCKLMTEQHNHPLSVIQVAAKLREKM